MVNGSELGTNRRREMESTRRDQNLGSRVFFSSISEEADSGGRLSSLCSPTTSSYARVASLHRPYANR